jgi:hypothetical protein
VLVVQLPGCVSVAAAETLKPGNSIEVLPTADGNWFTRLTVTVWPSVTISVGPGTCMLLHVALGMAAGANPAGATLQPYPHE